MVASSTVAHAVTVLPAWADARLRKIPAFPAAARKLMNLVGAESTNLQLIVQILKSDAVLAGETLRIANSALFALRYEVTSVMHAVSVLGLERLTAVIVTVGLRDLMRNPTPDCQRAWRHNLACALMAEQCAGLYDVPPANAYTAGLLHGIGYVALATCFAEEWHRAIEGMADAAELKRREMVQIGFTHLDAAAWLTQYWDLPEVLSETSQCDHLELTPQSGILGLVEWACFAADTAGFSVDPKWTTLPAEKLLALLPASGEKPNFPQVAEAVACKINDFEHNSLR